MNKLLGLLVLGLAFSLTIGTMGCNPNKDKDKDKKEEKKEEKKVEEKKTEEKKTEEKKTEEKKTEEKKDKKTKVEDATATVELKDIKTVEAKQSGDAKVTVELTKAAPADLTIKGGVSKVDEKIVNATGTIKKGESSGEVVITTKDAPVGVHTIDLVISGDKASGKGSFKLDVKK